MKKLLSILLVLAILPVGSFACTAIYVGSALTSDGSTIFARLEEYYSDKGWPKLFDVIPEGAHTAGEVYTGCYGFTWTFTHDSYGYTAFCDNNSQGICPDCGGTHAHTPYQAAGTNSRGVSVTATETLLEKEAVAAIDPFNTESGIEEAEIPTILLSEASSAREAMLLLTSIYASTGACGAGSVIAADSDEAWYIENLSGKQYIAVRLNADLLFVCPNISVIGLVDVHDQENVVASDGLIETAVRAGTFVGNAEAGLIDYAASFDDAPDSCYLRLAAGLNYLYEEAVYPEDLMRSGIDGSAFRISNVDSEGRTVAPYTDIRLKGKVDIRDVMAFFQQEPISNHRSLETHIFQISDGTSHGTVEWVSMADNRTSVFVPYYPMETAEVFAAFHPGTSMPEHTEEKPAEGLSYAMKDGKWGLYPEGWQDSWYWVFTRLEHIARDDEEASVSIRKRMDALQDQICSSGETGNQAAETAWLSTRELLEELETESAGWIMTESSEMTEDAMAAFDRAVQDLTDAVYEPVALLGKQQGIYCILCRARADDEDAKPYYTLLYAGENGAQNVWDLWIADHDMPKVVDEKEEKPVDIRTLLLDLASLREANDKATEDLEALKDNELAAFIVDKWQTVYMDPDYRLFIHGKDDPADLPVSGKHAFVILGFELENGEMRDELKARCEAAAAAAAAFPDSILICSGGATGENNPEGHTEAGLMKDYLVQTCGTDAERILIDENAMTTLENAVNTFAILKEQGIETITIVTSSYHQQRANLLYETLAEITRRKEGVSITVSGNYSCEVQPSEDLAKYDAMIAAMQVAELIDAMDDSVQ